MDANAKLDDIRSYYAEVESATDAGKARAFDALVAEVMALDIYLSAGGTPPEEWREGPDAPELNDDGAAWGTTIGTCSRCTGPVSEDAVIDGGHVYHGNCWRQWGALPEPLGGPIPGVNGSHLPEGAWKPSERPGVL